MAINFELPASMSWITSQSEPGTDAKDVIIERFQYITDFVSEAKDDLSQALSRLEASAKDVEVNALSVAGISVPDIEDEIPIFEGSFAEEFTATLDDFEFSYVSPGDMPDGSGIGWEDGEVSLEPEFVSVVAGWLMGGRTAIPDELAEQIVNSALVRLAEKRTASVVLLEAEAAAKGFLNPSGVDWARRAQIEAEYAKGATEINAKVAERDMELTQANFHKAAELANLYIANAQKYIIDKNLGIINHYKARVEAWSSAVDARIKEMQSHVEVFKGKVEAFVAHGTVYKTKGDVFESTVRAYEALVNGIRAKFDVISKNLETRIKVFEQEANLAIEEERLRVDAQKANVGFRQTVAQVAAQIHTQTVAQGLSSIHVQGGMSASHSTGQSVGYNYSRSENMIESHSESENVNTNV